MLKKLVFLSLFLIIHLHTYSQNACSNCSEYSLSENWSKLLDCLDSEIKKTDHHFDFLCRANLFGVIFENADSVLSGIVKYMNDVHDGALYAPPFGSHHVLDLAL